MVVFESSEFDLERAIVTPGLRPVIASRQAPAFFLGSAIMKIENANAAGMNPNGNFRTSVTSMACPIV